MKLTALCFLSALVLAAAADVKEWKFPDGKDFVRVLPAEEQPDYRDGFRVTAEFICDLEAFDKRKCFGNIVTKGRDFDQSFSVMIRKSGDLMVDLKGCDPEYEIVELGLKSGERHRLEVVVVPNAVRVSLDGKVCGGYATAGKFRFDPKLPIHVGRLGGYKFEGKLFPFRSKR